jgi:hypothetical protein
VVNHAIPAKLQQGLLFGVLFNVPTSFGMLKKGIANRNANFSLLDLLHKLHLLRLYRTEFPAAIQCHVPNVPNAPKRNSVPFGAFGTPYPTKFPAAIQCHVPNVPNAPKLILHHLEHLAHHIRQNFLPQFNATFQMYQMHQN